MQWQKQTLPEELYRPQWALVMDTLAGVGCFQSAKRGTRGVVKLSGTSTFRRTQLRGHRVGLWKAWKARLYKEACLLDNAREGVLRDSWNFPDSMS